MPAHDWMNYPDRLPDIIERMQGVVIENRPAAEVFPQHDSPETLFYCDPPYPFATRQLGKTMHRMSCYVHEMTDDDHRAFAEVARSAVGMVVISGYPCDLYDVELYPDWHRIEKRHHADGARDRTEVLWMNPQAARGVQGSLFG